MKKPSHTRSQVSALRRRAESRLRDRHGHQKPAVNGRNPATGPHRTQHELQVHQIELEMQNAELQEARERMEHVLENYTDLYDFAPVGYASLDKKGVIQEANLTAAALLGLDRSRLVRRRLHGFVAPSSRADFLAFVARVFARPGRQECAVSFLRETGGSISADLQGVVAASPDGVHPWCRVAISDITAIKRADAALRRVEMLAVSNKKLELEIEHRREVEAALKKGERDQRQMLMHSRQMQYQLRHYSHQILQAQEEERRRISRELHDEIAQTLVGINVHLESLARESEINPAALKDRIRLTQNLVEKSVDTVHRFALELRPTLLDDLGLIPALQSHLKEFTERTRVRVQFKAFTEVAQLSAARRTVLYRVAQSALANITQHARATEVRVTIQDVGGDVRMEIHDNGQAFNVERVLLAKRYKRLGILGMRERVEMVGGTFAVESAVGHGTTVRLQIPFKRAGKSGNAPVKPLAP